MALRRNCPVCQSRLLVISYTDNPLLWCDPCGRGWIVRVRDVPVRKEYL